MIVMSAVGAFFFFAMLAAYVGHAQLTGAKQGSNTLIARVRDRAFNTVDVSTTVQFDSQAPAIVSAAWLTNATTAQRRHGGVERCAARRAADAALGAASDSLLVALTGGCASVDGTHCRVTATQCPAGVCQLSLALSGAAVTGSPCYDPSHAPGDGSKRIAITPSDPAGNAGAPVARDVLLGRTCPAALSLSAVTLPQVVDVSGTYYVAASAIELRLDGGAGSNTSWLAGRLTRRIFVAE